MDVDKAKETSSWGPLHNYRNNISPPSNADDNEMLTYLSTTLTTIEIQYHGCGILPAGDFNRLNVSRLLTQFKMKQLFRSPTRGDRILDLVLTNLPQMYDKNGVKILPPFGLSDHNVVLLHPCKGQISSRRSTQKSNN